MERKIAKLLAITGVLVGTTAALTPLTSYAADSVEATTGAKQVALTVNSSISIDTSSGTTIEVTPHMLQTGNISATVTSTHPYSISLSSSQPDLTQTDNNTLIIPAKSTFTKDDNGWGIKKSGETGYTALTSTPTAYFTSDDPATGVKTDFEVGVAVNEETAPGTYQTDITVTAATTI